MRITADDLARLLGDRKPSDFLFYSADGTMLEIFSGLMQELEPDMDFPDAANFISFKAAMIAARRIAQVSPIPGSHPSSTMPPPAKLQVVELNRVVEQIRQHHTPGLSRGARPLDVGFMAGDPLENAVLDDYRVMQVMLSAHQYKAVVVFAGSVVEGLLIYALAQIPTQDLKRPQSGKGQPVGGTAKRWKLQHLLDGARLNRVISDETHKAAESIRDSRNYVHPQRVVSKSYRFDGGSATIAAGVVEKVAAEIGQWIGPPAAP